MSPLIIIVNVECPATSLNSLYSVIVSRTVHYSRCLPSIMIITIVVLLFRLIGIWGSSVPDICRRFSEKLVETSLGDPGKRCPRPPSPWCPVVDVIPEG